MKTTSIQARLAAILALCGPKPATDDSAAELDTLFRQHEIIVLPTTMAYSHSDVPKLSSNRESYTSHDVLFTFMDAQDGSSVDMRTVGICDDNGSHLSNEALQEARSNGLVHLFYRGLGVGELEETAPVPTTTEAVQAQVNATLPPDMPGVTTADKVAPKAQTKKELADDSAKLINWQNKVDTLSPSYLSEWAAHRELLASFEFLKPAEKWVLFGQMVRQGEAKAIGYNQESKAFYFLTEPILS